MVVGGVSDGRIDDDGRVQKDRFSPFKNIVDTSTDNDGRSVRKIGGLVK